MSMAVALVVIVAGALLFHFVNPWWLTPLASNWREMDDTLTITLVITAPPVTKSQLVSNTATVSSATSDPVPGNNSSTATIHVVPGRGPAH